MNRFKSLKNGENTRMRPRFRTRINLVILQLFVFATSSYSKTYLSGVGATFPFPIYSKWFDTFSRSSSDLEVSYQGLGSGAGIKQLLQGTIAFGASDVPMTDDQLKQSPSGITHFPTVLGSISIVVNIPGIRENSLKLSAVQIARIYLGEIYYWDHPDLVIHNSQLKSTHIPIYVVRRADGSGTTALFSRFLSNRSPQWHEKIGFGTSLKWKVGVGARGNDGVIASVENNAGAIGYVETLYAEKSKIAKTVAIDNRAGEFLLPNPASLKAALRAVNPIPSDLRIQLVDLAGKGVYPLSAATFILVPTSLLRSGFNPVRKAYDKPQAVALRRLFKFVYSDECANAALEMGFVDLPLELRRKILETAESAYEPL